MGDYYQFSTSTLGNSNIELLFDQTSSNTGPGQFQLQYSTDGVNFTPFGSAYTVLANASPNPVWNSVTTSAGYSKTVDLSSITALNNQPNAYFRLLDNSTISAKGSSIVGVTGTDRIDNVIIQTVPTQASLGLSLSTSVLEQNVLLGAPAADYSGTATVTNIGPATGNYSASSPGATFTLTGVGTSVAANSAANFTYALTTIPTANGVYTGNLTVTPSGTSNDAPLTTALNFYVGNPVADNSNSVAQFGPYTYIAHIHNGGSLAGLSSVVSSQTGVGGAGMVGSKAAILFGSNTSGSTITVGQNWRTRLQNEQADGTIGSDVLNATGIPGGDLYVLQMSYDLADNKPNQVLGEYVLGTWQNAVSGNAGGGFNYIGNVPWSSAYETLGEFGYDSTQHVAWAVLNHSGVFAAGSFAVPEPATLSVLVLGTAVLVVCRRRLIH